MMPAWDVPVVLFLFNRPRLLAQVIDVLVRARPRIVYAFADGPRPGRPDDVGNCAAARALLDRLEPQCRVVRDFADRNMGCEERVTSGLDRVFNEVPEAIILEDDIVPDISFFPWCARMLALYRDRSDVVNVSGRNHVGRWTQQGQGHCLLHRASCWGWATWRRAWRREVPMPGTPERLRQVAIERKVEPIVLEHFLMLQELALSGSSFAWDVSWELKNALDGGLTVTPSVNLTRNIGFGPNATHTMHIDDLSEFSPVGSMALDDSADRCLDDPKLERWLMMFELMANYREPHMVRLLARSAKFSAGKSWVEDRRLRLHFAPFADASDALSVLQHFLNSGAPAAPIQKYLDAFAAAQPSGSVAATRST